MAPTVPPEGPEPLPAGPTGPPTADRTAVRRGARQFRLLVDQRRVHLLNDQRDRAQIDSLCADGVLHWPAPAQPALKRNRAQPDAAVSDPTSKDFPTARDPGRGGTAIGTVRAEPVTPDGLDGDIPPADIPVPGKIVKPVPTSYSTEPPGELFLMLNALATHSSDDKPLAITSLLRPPYKTARYTMQNPGNPHALGIAVDIAAFGGHAVTTQDPEEEVQAFLSLLKALPPGRYRIGVPKAPDARPVDKGLTVPDELGGDPFPVSEGDDMASRRSRPSLPSRGTKRQDGVRRGSPPADSTAPLPSTTGEQNSAASVPPWPFFPPPQKGLDPQGKLAMLFANEHYAVEQYLNDGRLKKALTDARHRGVDVFALFPDGVNHIHIDVKQTP